MTTDLQQQILKSITRRSSLLGLGSWEQLLEIEAADLISIIRPDSAPSIPRKGEVYPLKITVAGYHLLAASSK